MAQTTSQLIEMLEQTARGTRQVIAFDGDGTLWSGDVSDDVYFESCHTEWFLEAARPGIEQALVESRLTPGSSLGQSARLLHRAQEAGQVSEQVLFEVMTYCYAGRTVAELTAHAAQILLRHGIERRIRSQARRLLDWARSAGHDCYLVSASPAPIVAVPACHLGFDSHHLIASSPALLDGHIGPKLARPIPYREQKAVQLVERAGERPILAAFGDSPFDIPMLDVAGIAVVVEPKPHLLAKMIELRSPLVLHWLPNQ